MLPHEDCSLVTAGHLVRTFINFIRDIGCVVTAPYTVVTRCTVIILNQVHCCLLIRAPLFKRVGCSPEECRHEARFGTPEIADVIMRIVLLILSILDYIGLDLNLVLLMDDPLRRDAHKVDVQNKSEQQSEHDVAYYQHRVLVELSQGRLVEEEHCEKD